MLDIKNQYFVAAIEAGSFSSAAKKFYVSQPALSKQIALLEQELNIKLFDRSQYRPVPTEAGLVYYHRIKHLMKEYENLIDEMRHAYQPVVRIAFTGLIENTKTVHAFQMLQSEMTNLKVSFVKCDFQDSLRKLLNGEVDLSFGIETTFQNQENVCYDVLFQQEICVICSFDHPFCKCTSLTMNDLGSEKMIVLSKKFGENFYKSFFEACKTDHFKPHIFKEVDSFDELVFEVSIGNGIAIVSKDVVRGSDVKMIDLKHSHHTSCYVVAYLKSANENVRHLVEEVKERLK